MILEFLTFCFKFGFLLGLFGLAVVTLFYCYVLIVNVLIKLSVFIFKIILQTAVFVEDKLRR